MNRQKYRSPMILTMPGVTKPNAKAKLEYVKVLQPEILLCLLVDLINCNFSKLHKSDDLTDTNRWFTDLPLLRRSRSA